MENSVKKPNSNTITLGSIFHNIIVGLAVSIIMLNLGAALGLLSGRGAFAGMLSAGLIALVTSAFGGSRIQGSGLTAPMSTVTAVIVAYSLEQLPQEVSGISAEHFVNIVLLMTAVILVIFGLLKVGRFIRYVPNLVVSGFMCGIAIIIWTLQFKAIFGIDRDPLGGSVLLNSALACLTLFIAFVSPLLLKRVSLRLNSFLPGTLLALIVVSLLAYFIKAPVEYLTIDVHITNLSEFTGYIAQQIPTQMTFKIFMLALPFAIKLAALCYIDTLLTSLIIDKMRGTKTRQNKELIAQGLSTSIIGFIGGVPGAQSTVPSVLTVKEGATMRLAGISAGLFVIINMMIFSNLMNYIPQAVFVGILLKVGYDVFDFKPIYAYLRTIRRELEQRKTKVVRHKEISILSGTALVTAFVDLIVAVGAFSASFLIYNHVSKKRKKKKINDYVPK